MMRSIFLVGFAFLASISKAEKEGGGGFEFYNTDVNRVIRESQDLAVQVVQGWPEKVWRSSYFPKSVNREKLSGYIKNAHVNKEKEIWRNNPDGEKDPIMMNYVEAGDYIEILLPTFREVKERLNRFENLDDIRLDIARALVHESLHLFGYEESEAYRASRLVYGFEAILACDKATVRYPEYQCIFPTPDRVLHVQGLLDQWMKNKGPQPYVILFGDPSAFMFQVDLMTKFSGKKLTNIKISNRGSEWATGNCNADLSPLMECTTNTDTYYFADISKASVFYYDPKLCASTYECNKALWSNDLPSYLRKKLGAAQSGTIVIKRK